ncbi:response regulator [Puniceicoccaceae bacterium K14]|nr:response regulator [Puniceicoccaceae bacterium K14]
MFNSDSSQLELWNSKIPKKLESSDTTSPTHSSVQSEQNLGELFQGDSNYMPVLQKSFATSHPLKILIVDDNSINRKIIRVMLSKLGYESSEAADGQEALTKHLSNKYDYIFMDLDMPVMSGVEATSEIRKLKDTEGGKAEIVAVTANVSCDSRQKCRNAGMNGYLEKPITTSVVKTQILQSWARLRKRKAFKSKTVGL